MAKRKKKTTERRSGRKIALLTELMAVHKRRTGLMRLIALGLVLKYNLITGTEGRWIGLCVAIVCAIVIGWSLRQSKRESKELKEMEKHFEQS